MVEYKLTTPLKEEDVRKLSIEDVVYVSGIIYTARDMAHRRFIELAEKGQKPPVQMDGAVIYHAGPVVRKLDGEWEVVSAGPTTSSRMNRVTPTLLKYYTIRMIIGKGGMSREVADALKERGAVYCHYTGGAAVLAAKCVKRVVKVEWLDLGVPEALWVLEVEDFGPLIVTMDAQGNSLYEKLELEVSKRVRGMLRR
ncbi:MAG: FumA C-terminus/TtdB family hydratase beta subunit [Candidatus Nezhaarchaeales archaeon]|nr:MAG: fumarate hydratase [Candidatus Nezhaarchaeota archaeon WYZ-LMO8]TDA37338.1 MAG: fumarate hydratase [Candidatus Nezhaarchaeota archaeon WYZ-LMO7]